MGATKKPRKAYRPRPALANSIEFALNGSALLPAQVQNSYLGPLCSLIGRIKQGAEDHREWSRVRDAVMICEALMETGAAEMPKHERNRLVGPWLDAIESAVARRRRGPRDGLTAAERDQLDSMLTWYAALLSEATQAQLLTAQRHALRRVAQALTVINREVRAAGLPECGLSPELERVARPVIRG